MTLKKYVLDLMMSYPHGIHIHELSALLIRSRKLGFGVAPEDVVAALRDEGALEYNPNLQWVTFKKDGPWRTVYERLLEEDQG